MEFDQSDIEKRLDILAKRLERLKGPIESAWLREDLFKSSIRKYDEEIIRQKKQQFYEQEQRKFLSRPPLSHRHLLKTSK